MDSNRKKVITFVGVFFISFGLLLVFIPRSAILTGYSFNDASDSYSPDPMSFLGIGLFVLGMFLVFLNVKKKEKSIQEIIERFSEEDSRQWDV